MAKFKNWPSFNADNEENNEKAEESNLEIEKPLLSPIFISSSEITFEACQKEVDRVLKNLEKLRSDPKKLIEEAPSSLVIHLLGQVTNYNYNLNDLQFLPSEVSEEIYNQLAKCIYNHFHDNLTADRIYKDIKAQMNEHDDHLDSFNDLCDEINNGLDLADIVSDLNLEHLYDLSTTELKKQMIESGTSEEYANTLTEMIKGTDMNSLSEIKQFNDAMEQDPFVKSMYKLNKKFYGEHILGAACPTIKDASLPDIEASIVYFDEDNGDINMQFIHNNKVVDYEDLLELFGDKFKKWISKWKIEPSVDYFIFKYKYDNLISKYVNDPISELSEFANISYLNPMIEAYKLMSNSLSELKDIFNSNPVVSTEDLKDDLTFSYIDDFSRRTNLTLRSCSMPEFEESVKGTNQSLELLFNAPFGTIPFDKNNINIDEFTNMFKSAHEVIDNANIVLTDKMKELNFPFVKEHINEKYDILYHGGHILLIEFKLNISSSPIIAAAVAYNDNFTLFFPELYNSFVLKDDKVSFNLEYDLNYILAIAQATVYYKTKLPNTLKNLGIMKNYISDHEELNSQASYYQIGRIFLNDSDVSQKFKTDYNLSSNNYPLYLKIPKLSKFDENQGIVHFIFSSNIWQTGLFQNAVVMYENKRAIIELPIKEFAELLIANI